VGSGLKTRVFFRASAVMIEVIGPENGPTLTSATNKRDAEFCTTDRIGDDVPVNGCPLLFPGSKSRV
jgi:hypothetical protein